MLTLRRPEDRCLAIMAMAHGFAAGPAKRGPKEMGRQPDAVGRPIVGLDVAAVPTTPRNGAGRVGRQGLPAPLRPALAGG